MGRPRKVPTPTGMSWRQSGRCTDELSHGIAPLLADIDPPNRRDGPEWMPSDAGCAHLSDAQRLPVEPVTRAFPR